MITEKNESKILTKDICECKCKFDGRKCNSNQKWNNDKCRCECKKHHISEKDYICNPDECSCENGKYLEGIIDDSVITCDEIIEETKAVPTNFNAKKQPVEKFSLFYVLPAFLLTTITLLIAASIYCYLMNYQEKQKHLLPFQVTNNKLREAVY